MNSISISSTISNFIENSAMEFATIIPTLSAQLCSILSSHFSKASVISLAFSTSSKERLNASFMNLSCFIFLLKNPQEHHTREGELY